MLVCPVKANDLGFLFSQDSDQPGIQRGYSCIEPYSEKTGLRSFRPGHT